jgi:hypothetical protein
MPERLKNGAFVLREREYKTGERAEDKSRIVLALVPDESYQPFVTWVVNADGFALWGSYYETLDEAEASFKNRVEGATLLGRIAA